MPAPTAAPTKRSTTTPDPAFSVTRVACASSTSKAAWLPALRARTMVTFMLAKRSTRSSTARASVGPRPGAVITQAPARFSSSMVR